NPRSNIHRALVTNPGAALPHDARTVYTRNLEVPSGGGAATARGLARAARAFATDGRELGLRRQTLDALAAPAVPSVHGFHDECMHGDAPFALGLMKSRPTFP